jgi:hypothetical protein
MGRTNGQSRLLTPLTPCATYRAVLGEPDDRFSLAFAALGARAAKKQIHFPISQTEKPPPL